MAKKSGFTGEDLHVRNVTFVEAGDNPAVSNGFEPSVNMDAFIESLIGPSGRNMDYAVKRLTVNGNTADAFKLLWDYLDDEYVGAANYYVSEINEAFVRLGVEYAQYLEMGGVPLTDVVVKYARDDIDPNVPVDSDDRPERLQSMHDNLLGNLDGTAITGRFAQTPLLHQQLLQYIASQDLSYVLTRPVFDGADHKSPALTIAWDVAHGYLGAYQTGPGHRGRGHDKNGDGIDDHQNTTGKGHGAADDRLHAKRYDRDFGELDPSSTKNGAGTEMEVGSGISDENFNIFVNHDADIELALKLHERFPPGDDIMPTSFSADGTAYYSAPDGSRATSSGPRAEWNFDFSVNTGIEGSSNTLDAFDFRMVVESGDGQRAVFDLQHLGPGVTPWTDDLGGAINDDDGYDPQLSQNSVNLGFAFMQAHFGADYNNVGAHYDIYLQAFDGNRMIGEVHQSIDIL